MNTTLSAVILAACVAIPGLAHAATDSELANRYFNKTSPALDSQERSALAIAKRWESDSATGVRPVAGAGGAIQFAFGTQQPSIVCAVLQICDVALQPGEQVNSVNLGDTARWSVEPAISGGGADEVQHLIIKPLDVGLQTSLVVTTNRRTYHLRLRSHRTEYMPQVSFSYPGDSLTKWQAQKQQETRQREQTKLAGTGEYLGDLSFDYEITGTASFKPVRVFNDGRKTILEMPRSMRQTEAPTLLVVRKDGGPFSDDDTVMVNYRVQGNRYIVDTVFARAILIAGVGRAQQRVTITRSK